MRRKRTIALREEDAQRLERVRDAVLAADPEKETDEHRRRLAWAFPLLSEAKRWEALLDAARDVGIKNLETAWCKEGRDADE